MQHDYVLKKLNLDSGCGVNIWYFLAACIIVFNGHVLKKLNFDPTPKVVGGGGGAGESAGNIFATMLLRS